MAGLVERIARVAALRKDGLTPRRGPIASAARDYLERRSTQEPSIVPASNKENTPISGVQQILSTEVPLTENQFYLEVYTGDITNAHGVGAIVRPAGWLEVDRDIEDLSGAVERAIGRKGGSKIFTQGGESWQQQ